jgi:hypothetical protein
VVVGKLDPNATKQVVVIFTSAQGSYSQQLVDEGKEGGVVFNSSWYLNGIKYDLKHFLAVLFLMVRTACSLYASFCSIIADSVLLRLPGETERVKKHFRALGLTENEIKALPRRTFRRLCMHFIPPPRLLYRLLVDAVLLFEHVVDPDSNDGTPFLLPTWRNILDNALTYVCRGELSDRPAVPLYVFLKTLATGFDLHRCLRGSSALEGMHLHLRILLNALVKSLGLERLDAMMLQFDYRWTVKALRHVGLLGTGWLAKARQHFRLELADELFRMVVKLGLSADLMPSHVPADTKPGQPLVRNGTFYLVKALAEQANAVAAVGVGAAVPPVDIATQPQHMLPFLSDDAKDHAQWHYNPTKADLIELLSHSELHEDTPTNKTKLNEIAARRGLLFPNHSAHSLVEGVLNKTRSGNVLAHVGLPGVRAQARAVAEEHAPVAPRVMSANMSVVQSSVPAPQNMPAPPAVNVVAAGAVVPLAPAVVAPPAPQPAAPPQAAPAAPTVLERTRKQPEHESAQSRKEREKYNGKVRQRNNRIKKTGKAWVEPPLE